ncbi:MAG: GTP-binding protein, partial [Dehalococcoidia bacterium]|nr:GTP-binding protein [Dehalococcoidia bacterium]
ITRLGNPDDGTTTSDYDPDEIKRKISISLSLLPCQWKDSKLNLIDTPGYPDFVAEVKAGLAVSEGAVIVVCAASGVEVGTEVVWEYVSEAKLPCLIFVNKMDRENASFFDTLKGHSIQTRDEMLTNSIADRVSERFSGNCGFGNEEGVWWQSVARN